MTASPVVTVLPSQTLAAFAAPLALAASALLVFLPMIRDRFDDPVGLDEYTSRDCISKYILTAGYLQLIGFLLPCSA